MNTLEKTLIGTFTFGVLTLGSGIYLENNYLINIGGLATIIPPTIYIIIATKNSEDREGE